MGDTHGVGSPTGTFSMVYVLPVKSLFLIVDLRSHVEMDFPVGYCDSSHELIDVYILNLANTLCEAGVFIPPIRADLVDNVHKP